jgi:hypothetical protein
MDLSPEQAEDIAREVARHPDLDSAVGPRVLAAVLLSLDDQRALNRKILSAFAEQAEALHTARQELATLRRSGGQGGETGSEPPPPIAPPADAAKLLATEPGPAPRQLPTASELFWQGQRARYVSVHQYHPEHDETHRPFMDDAHCEACSILMFARGV